VLQRFTVTRCFCSVYGIRFNLEVKLRLHLCGRCFATLIRLLLGRGEVRCSIRETLSHDTLKRKRRAATVINAKRDTVAIAEIKFCEITMKVFSAQG
jgi:hypothetical protein